MLNLSHTLRSFNRFELKYILTLKEAERFKRALQAYLVPDEHGSNNRGYVLTSLYYDSPDLRCYWEKENGLRFRRKLRIRWYENRESLTDEAPVFVEIKQRIDRVTQKRRAILPYVDALRLCNDRQIPDHVSEDRRFIEETCAFAWQYNLQPTSIVRYNRQALVGTNYDLGLRVTFDTALTYRTQDLSLHEKAATLPLFRPECVVMEIKVNERIPYWLTEMVAANNLTLVRMSKYCRSIELTQNFPLAHWLVEAN